MTFSLEEIREFRLEPYDEWIFDDDDNGLCYVMIQVGEKTFDRFLGWVGLTREQYENSDHYFDIYARIDAVTGTVFGLYINWYMGNTNTDATQFILPTELDINIVNPPEKRYIFSALAKSGGKQFEEFINEAKRRVNDENNQR
jgi:hypothetical protein